MVLSKSVSDHKTFPWNQVSWAYVPDHNMITGTDTIKCNSKIYYNISIFKAHYFVRGGVSKLFPPEGIYS